MDWEDRKKGEVPPTPRRRVVLVALVVLMLLVTGALFYFTDGEVTPSPNRLALGTSATVEQVDIAASSVRGSNFITRIDLLDLRSQQAAEYRELFTIPYAPSKIVFGRIREDKPWWSSRGFYYDGKVAEIPEGPISEGRWIFNPFMLVAPEFWGLSIWGKGNLKWMKDKISDEQLLSSDFPYYPKISHILYRPRERTATVSMDITAFLSTVAPLVTEPLPNHDITFGIGAYNAVDLGLDYILFDPSASTNVENPKQPTESKWIADALIFSEDMCGNDGGCNHRNNVMPYYDSLIIKSLPAKAVFKLWQGTPREPRPPTITYTIEFK